MDVQKLYKKRSNERNFISVFGSVSKMGTLMLFVLWMTSNLAFGGRVPLPSSCPLYEQYYCACDGNGVAEVTTVKMCMSRNESLEFDCTPCPTYEQDLLNCSKCPERTCLLCSKRNFHLVAYKALAVQRESKGAAMEPIFIDYVPDANGRQWHNITNEAFYLMSYFQRPIGSLFIATNLTGSNINVVGKNKNSTEDLDEISTPDLLFDVKDQLEIHQANADLNDSSTSPEALFPNQLKEVTADVQSFNINYTKVKSRSKREIPNNSWCTIKRRPRNANVNCTVWSDKKECTIACHNGYVFGPLRRKKLLARCYRKENYWKLKLRDCKKIRGVLEQSPNFWHEMGQQDLRDALRIRHNNRIAKNLIIFVGDGMGVSTVMASRLYQGQSEGRTGEESQLSFEKFPYTAFAKTYSVSHQVADSASTATALFTGVKTNTAMIGVSASAKVNDCDSLFGNQLTSILDWAQQAGKDTGLVTTTRVTHATPAALYGHSPHRDWENDAWMPPNATRCKDLARQLVEDLPGRNLKVIFGGGRNQFKPVTYRDAASNKTGNRKDGLDLIDYWMKEKANRNVIARYITTADELASVSKSSVDYVLGLFNHDHLKFELDKKKEPKGAGEPSLAAMTKAAINILQKSNKGFFLMVEGGRIDHAHHRNNAIRALSETVSMAEAVQAAVNMTSSRDTLVVVTADHSHVMTVNGYPKRGNPILGIAGMSDKDNLNYTTLLYTNGPSYHVVDGKRRNLNGTNTGSKSFFQDVAVHLSDESHGGEDVPIYASGPMAHLFRGVVEQSYVAHVMAYASCIGRNKEHCTQTIGDQS